MLSAAGLPDAMLPAFVETEDAIARGELATVTSDLSRLIGRSTTPLSAAIKAQLVRADTAPTGLCGALAEQDVVQPRSERFAYRGGRRCDRRGYGRGTSRVGRRRRAPRSDRSG
jgi:hypothetical protein